MSKTRDFDTVAEVWDEKPQRVKLAEDIANAMIEKLPLSDKWSAVDFGCGTGLVTLKLAPKLGTITGVDGSNGMLAQLNAKIAGGDVTNVSTITADEFVNLPESHSFDLIVSAMTLHHIEDIQQLFAIFKSRLKIGGMIALADLAAEDGTFHEDPTGVFHHGFKPEELTEKLTAAGFTSITVEQVATIVRGEVKFPVNMACATA